MTIIIIAAEVCAFLLIIFAAGVIMGCILSMPEEPRILKLDKLRKKRR